MSCADVVFVVPGFLGFERAGNFSHFADRVCSALRAHMEGRLGRQVRVIPLGSLPTTSFAERQRLLLESIARRTLALGGVERIHLLGHGVGGIDGYLLGCARALDGAYWTELDPHGLRGKIKTLVSLATPHHGTCLAAAPGAGALTLGALVSDPKGAFAMLQLVQKLFASALHDVGWQEPQKGLAREGRKVSHFMAELLRWQGFLHALTPEAMAGLYARCEPLPGVTRRSLVTMAGRAVELPGPRYRAADGLFQELSRRTSGAANGFTRHEPAVRRAVMRLRDAISEVGPRASTSGSRADPRASTAAVEMIVSDHARPPVHVDAQTNDGVVNSARQLIDPDDDGELYAVVVADHLDVLGYYDRGMWLAEPGGKEQPHELLSGLLHSGSCFRDAEFFALYRLVGDAIVTQCVVSAEPAALARERAQVGARERELAQAEGVQRTQQMPRRAPSRRPSV
jgi:hypothetical protein